MQVWFSAIWSELGTAASSPEGSTGGSLQRKVCWINMLLGIFPKAADLNLARAALLFYRLPAGARLAQRKSTSFTRKGSQVQILQRAPSSMFAGVLRGSNFYFLQ